VTFHDLLKDCAPGGRLRAAGLTFFAGKNIAALLTNQPGIQNLHSSLKSLDTIGDDVIRALARDPNPHTWLPEWGALRSAVEAWTP